MIFHGGEPAGDILSEMSRVLKVFRKENVNPTLAVIFVGYVSEDPDVGCFVSKIIKTGINVKYYCFDQTADSSEVCKRIIQVNADDNVHGVYVKSKYYGENDDLMFGKLILPEKDVDCLTNLNRAKLFNGDVSGFVPCEAEAVMELLKYYEIKIAGKIVTVLSDKKFSGKATGIILLNNNATVTYCFPDNEFFTEFTKESDIVVSFLNKSNFINRDCVTGHTIVIDGGCNVNPCGKICGDADYKNIYGKVKCVSPVPGGIDLLSAVLLAKHVVQAAENICRR